METATLNAVKGSLGARALGYSIGLNMVKDDLILGIVLVTILYLLRNIPKFMNQHITCKFMNLHDITCTICIYNCLLRQGLWGCLLLYSG
jgi:hypothetical protein